MKNFIFGLVLISCEGQTSVLPKSLGQPNIVVILADDLGYGSINPYGADDKLVKTPNINKLAFDGISFLNAHTPSSVCSPTRYGLLTGRYPWRSSLKWGVVNPGQKLIIEDSIQTIAEYLKEKGYNTAAIGKWHLGYNDSMPVDFTKKLKGPLDLGFDYHFGVPYNHGDRFGVYIENDHVYQLRSAKIKALGKNFYGATYTGYDAPQREDEKVMERITEKSLEWLNLQNKKKPFFLYFSTVAVHDPITPSLEMLGKSNCGSYGDFIKDIDLSVGKIMGRLEEKGLLKNTIVIFTSDNGGKLKNDPNSPQYQATQKGLEINGHLKGDKGKIWEGGTKVPFIARWHKEMKGNRKSNERINVIDIYATVIDILDGKMPEDKAIASDSFSFLNTLVNNKGKSEREYMITADVRGINAIYRGNFKYIDNIAPEGLPKRLEKGIRNLNPQLYNLLRDTLESRNVLKIHREVALELKKKLNDIRISGFSR